MDNIATTAARARAAAPAEDARRPPDPPLDDPPPAGTSVRDGGAGDRHARERDQLARERDQHAREPEVAQLAENLTHLLRRLTRARNQFLAEARHDVEWAAQVLISHLAAGGPMRLGALAASVQSDPSTVSRQVTALVKGGYVERRTDPDDGRAVVLGVTAAGEAIYRDHVRTRNERYQQMLSDWSSEDLVAFATLLRRFGEAVDTHQHAWNRPSRALSGIGGGEPDHQIEREGH